VPPFYRSRVVFEGSQTLAGAGTVELGYNDCQGLGLSVPGSTLTIGPGLTIRSQGGYNYVGVGICSPATANVTLVNQGVIRCEAGTIVLAGAVVTNLGLFQADGGTVDVRGLRGSIGQAQATNRGHLILDGTYVNDQDRIFVDSTLTLRGAWTNAAVLTLASNATLSLTNGTWANLGSIVGTNVTLNLGGSATVMGVIAFPGPGSVVNVTGSFTSTQLQSISYGSGAVSLRTGAVIDNRGQVLALNEITGTWLFTGGTIRGGTITTTNGARLYAYMTGQSAVLDGVTINGEIDVYSGAWLRVVNGLTLNGTMYVGSQADASYVGFVEFQGSQTLGGNGTVVFGRRDGNGLLLVGAGMTLTLGPAITVRGIYGQLLALSGYPQNVSLVNQGTIAAQGRIVVTVQGLTNSGTLHAAGGTLEVNGLRNDLGRLQSSSGTLRINGAVFGAANIHIGPGGVILFPSSFTLDDTHSCSIQQGGTFYLTSNLLGQTRSPGLFAAPGIIAFQGSANGVNPQFLEVMSRDIGPDIAGFSSGFALGTLRLANSTYVRLVDLSDNSPGLATEREALYVNSVIVPGGATLDLNGLRLYARATQIDGPIQGGTIERVADGGAIAQSSPTSGNISTAGELDEWTFFGWADQTMVVLVDTGSSNVVASQLRFAEVAVLDPTGGLISRASNTVAGAIVVLSDILLPLDGTYRVRVDAPANQPASTGNYLVTLWETTPDVSPLVLSQTAHGRIETPYSVDRWTFSAVAGQQVRFDLINASLPCVAFSLRGPNGPLGFTNLVNDSGLVNLPWDGGYTLSAFSLNGAYDIDYAFQLIETVQNELSIGNTFNGQFVGSGQAMLFRLNLPGDQPFRIVLQNAGANNRVELYSAFGLPPTRGAFALADNQGAGSTRQIVADNTYPGTHYVLVYADSIGTPGPFTLAVQSADFFFTGLLPRRAALAAGPSSRFKASDSSPPPRCDWKTTASRFQQAL